MTRTPTIGRLLAYYAFALLMAGLLASIWEFGLEDWLLGGEGHVEEALGVRIKYVLTAMAFTGLALLAPAWYGWRSARQQRASEGQLLRLSEIIEQTTDFVGSASPDGHVHYINRAGVALAGRQGTAERQDWRIADFHPPKAARHILEEALPAAARHGVWSGMSELLTGDGRVIPVSLVIITHRDGRGGVSRYSTIMRDVSRERQTGEQMRLLSSVMAQSADSVIITDRNAMIEYVNAAFEQMTGYGADEVIGRPAGLLKSGRMDAAFYSRLWTTLGQGRVFRGEFTNRRKDGSLYQEEKVIAPIRDADGEIGHFVSTGRDVTSRRALERRMQENERLLSRAEAITHLGSWEWSIQSDRLILSAEFFRILGQEPGHFGNTLESFLGYVHADDRRRVRAELAGLQAEGTVLNLDVRIVRRGGEVRLLHLQAELERSTADVPLRLAGVAHDVTERRRQEDNLLLWARALESTISPVLITDANQPDNPILYVNSAFERVTGYDRNEAVGRNCRFMQGEDRDQPDLAVLREALAQGREAHVVLRNYRKDGSLFWNELRVAPVRDENGHLTHFIGVQNDITERRTYEDQLLHQSHYDALTGLANRVLLQERLRLAVAQAERSQQGLAVLFIDLDNFKMVNDSLGHELGDELLSAVARRLDETLRQEDTVARYGGDEFVVVLAELGSQEVAESVAEKLHTALSRAFDVRNEEIFLTTSIGIALYPGDGVLPEELVRRADIALYRAKDQGGNATQFYAEELGERMTERRTISKHLHRALERDEFRLHYQPQLDLHNGRICGAEALIRWQHPDLGMVAPDRFIPIAEETGIIIEIGNWVLSEACRQGKAWLDAGRQLVVAVNISSRQFRQKDLRAQVADALQASGLPANCLELEITEGTLMQNVAAATAILAELRRLGVRIAIDDFGTGYSSLAYLKNFPIDRLKIDRSFVRDVVHDPDDAAIARAVVSLAHDMGMKAIAEGVEDEAQLAFLRAVGCDELQGYWLSKPRPAEELSELLLTGVELPGKQERERVLLVVDDEANVLTTLKRQFRSERCRVLTAADPAAAFELLARHPVGVVLAEHRLPGMSGVEFMRKVKRMYPGVTRMILSGYADIRAMRDAINEGSVYKFLAKPWEDAGLRALVREGFERFELEAENQGLYHRLREAYAQTQNQDREMLSSAHTGERMALHEQRVLQTAQAVLEETPVAIIGADEEGMVAMANAAARQLFGNALLGSMISEHLSSAMIGEDSGVESRDGRRLHWQRRELSERVPGRGNYWTIYVEEAI